jgi:uncharacterized membrane protein HdeD (DUF308 family)
MSASQPMPANRAQTADTIAAIGRSRGWRIGLGVMTAVAGALILAWPGGALLAVAILVGIELIVAGIFRIVTAFSFGPDGAATRVLFVVLGLLLIVVGVLCLRAPFHTTAILVLLFGVSCVFSGVIELFHGFGGGGGGAIVSGVVGVLVGIVVLVYPVSSVTTLIWLFGIALLVLGLASIVGAMFGASRGRATAAVSHAARPATP